MAEEITNTATFSWILDEDLLRDEGVVFGLAGTDPDAKIAVIEQYYADKVVSQKQQNQDTQGRLEELEMQLTDLLVNTQTAKAAILAEETKVSQRSLFIALPLVKFLTALGVVFLGAFVIKAWLSFSSTFTLPGAIGIYLFGLLVLHAKDSVLFNHNHSDKVNYREWWKILLEEFIVPLTLALFLFFWGHGNYAMTKRLSFTLMIFLFFLFSGKFLIFTIKELEAATRDLSQQREAKRQQQKVIDQWQQEKIGLEQSILEKKVEIQSLKEKIDAGQIQVAHLEQEKELKISYFLSEYHLAKTAKENYSAEQLFRITYNQRNAHG